MMGKIFELKIFKYFLKFYVFVGWIVSIASICWFIGILTKLNLDIEETCKSKFQEGLSIANCLEKLATENQQIGIVAGVLLFISLCGLGSIFFGRKLLKRCM
jgi:hypothetical protein